MLGTDLGPGSLTTRRTVFYDAIDLEALTADVGPVENVGF